MRRGDWCRDFALASICALAFGFGAVSKAYSADLPDFPEELPGSAPEIVYKDDKSVSFTSGVWAEIVGNRTTVDDRLNGFDQNVYGLVVGIDRAFDNILIGLNLDFSTSNVESANNGRFSNMLQTFGGGFYGGVDFGNAYIELQGRANVGSIETKRDDGNMLGEADAFTYMGSAFIGYDFDLSQSFILTPYVGISYHHSVTDNYIETDPNGVGGALEYAQQTNYFLDGEAGLEAQFFVSRSASLNFRAAVERLLSSDNDDGMLVRPVGVAQYTRVENVDIAETIYSLAIGGSLSSEDGRYYFEPEYTYSFNEDLTSHTARARVGVNF